MSPAGYETQVIDRSARRREKSRDAARCRRQQESDTYNEICDVIPIPAKVLSQMDRSSVMRLLISFIKLRKVVQKVSLDHLSIKQEVCNRVPSDEEFVNALNGFLLVLSHDCDILYVSTNVKQYIGITSLDLIGQNLFGYTHEGDHGEITKCLKTNINHEDKNHNFFMRMKSTLTPSGKNVNLKSATYKVLKCDGIVHHTSERANSYMVAYCEPIPHPANIEMTLDCKTFLSQHSLDMKFTYCDNDRISQLLGYSEKDMTGKSFYEFCHAVDLKSIESSLQKLFRLGQVTTGHYRMLAKYGGYVWVVSQATIINNPRNQQPSYIVCVHYIISEIVEGHLMISTTQMQSLNTSVLPLVKQESEDLMETESQDSSNAMFFDSTNSIFCDINVDAEKNTSEALETAPSSESMAQNAPSIGDQVDYSQINLPEMLDFDPMENLCASNAPSIEDPPWNYPSSIQEGKIEDLFTDVNINSGQEFGKDPSSCFSKPQPMSPPRLLSNAAPGLRRENMSTPFQFVAPLPVEQRKQTMYQPQVPVKAKPPQTGYKVVSVPKAQYQQHVQKQPMKRPFNGKVVDGVFSCEVAKKKKLLPQYDGSADCRQKQQYNGHNIPDAAKLLLGGNYNQSSLASLLLNNSGDKGMVYGNSPVVPNARSPCRGSAPSRLPDMPRRNPLLPVLSLHDCEVNAPVDDNFSNVDWIKMSSALCI